MKAEQIKKIASDYLNDCEEESAVLKVFDIAIKAVEQEPNGDTISRILKRMWNCRGKHTTSIDKVKMEQIIRDELPLVKPQEHILDKIRAEIEHIADEEHKHDEKWAIGLRYAVKIIDKYKAESEKA